MTSEPKQLNAEGNTQLNIKATNLEDQISENESQFELASNTFKRIFGAKDPLLIKKNRAERNKLHWTPSENILYKKFLQQNINFFESNDQNRKVKKINVLMSKRIKRKTPDQCRSHHQKMMQRHKTVAGIIDFFEQIQNDHSKPKRKPRTKEGGLQTFTKNSPVQQVNNRSAEERLEIVQIQSLIQWPSQIESQQKQHINQRQFQIQGLRYDLESIQGYQEPNLWWDGFEI